MPKPGKVLLEDPCTECKQPCTFEMADSAREFGHIYSVTGLRAFMKDGVCEWCGDILADFAHMGRVGDFLP